LLSSSQHHLSTAHNIFDSREHREDLQFHTAFVFNSSTGYFHFHSRTQNYSLFRMG